MTAKLLWAWIGGWMVNTLVLHPLGGVYAVAGDLFISIVFFATIVALAFRVAKTLTKRV